jgi:hypothetical protein
MTARFIMCSKGFCEFITPFAILYGTMSGLDELRAIKGHEPIFKPFIANLIIPDTELNSLSEQRKKYVSYLTKISIEKRCGEEEIVMIDKLLSDNIIKKEDADI